MRRLDVSLKLANAARITGRERGWSHASYVSAYGCDSHPLEVIKAERMPGWIDTYSAVSAYDSGFDEGIEFFNSAQYPDGTPIH